MEHPHGVLHQTDEIVIAAPFHSLVVCAESDYSDDCRGFLASCVVAVCFCVVGLSAGFGCRQRQTGQAKASEFLLSTMELHHPALQLRIWLVDVYFFFTL